MKQMFMGLAIVAAIVGICAYFFAGGTKEETDEPFTGPLRVGVECDYPPYNWEEKSPNDTNVELFNRDGLYADGYDVQIAKRIAGLMGVELEILKVPWDGLLAALNDGQINVIISGMADTPERRSLPQFSNSVNYTAHAIEYCVMVRKNGRYFNAATLADFYGAKIIGQKGSMLDAVIDQIPGVVHVEPSDTASDMFRMLGEGKVDGVVMGFESVQDYMKTYLGIKAIRFPRNDGFKLGFTGACAWVRKNDKALLNAINKAISDISVEEKQELMERAQNRGIAQ